MTGRLAAEVLADYLVEVGAALVRYGCPSYRLEEVLKALALREGMDAESFALPTGVFLNVLSADGPPVHRMARVKSWTLDLGRLTEIDAIFNDVAIDRVTLIDGIERVRALEERPPAYPSAVRAVAPAALAASAATFLGGSVREMVAAAISGLLIGGAWRLSRRSPQLRLLGDLLGAVLAALVALVAARLEPQASREVITLSGLILLVPGMTFTTGLAELVHKNLVSGAARLMEAFVTLLSLVTGVGVALTLEHWLRPGPPSAGPPLALPLPFQLAALLVAGLAFAVQFSVPRRSVALAVGSAVIGWACSRALQPHGSASLAAFCASLAVCLYANLLARITQRPAQLFQLPGMILLVPGSFGFISFTDLARGDVAGGVERAMQMVLVAGALVMGVLVANALLHPRKLL